jgi:hypothetical protein
LDKTSRLRKSKFNGKMGNPQQDTIELDNFANVQTVQQLQSLVTADAHGDAFIDLGHQDSIAFAGTTPAQLQVVLQSAFHLH